MRARGWLLPALLLLPVAAMAQSGPAQTSRAAAGETVLQPLPDPAAGEDGPVVVYLQNARMALTAGRLGEAEEALERAQTRRLTRPVDMRHTEDPSQDPVVHTIGEARAAIASGDKAGALAAVTTALGQVAQH